MGREEPSRPSGLSLIELIVLIGLFGLTILLGIFLLGNERARTRDAQRLADMNRVQAAFQILYFEKASYAAAAEGCPRVGDDVADCGLGRYLAGFSVLRDPGKYAYTISKVPDQDGYEVAFTLERSYGTLEAGSHTLTKNGIR